MEESKAIGPRGEPGRSHLLQKRGSSCDSGRMLSQRRVEEDVGLDQGEECPPAAFWEDGDLEAEVGTGRTG